MRIKPRHRRDFDAYVEWGRIDVLNPKPYPIVIVGPTSPIEAFVVEDSTGKRAVECSDPKTLSLAWNGKADLNRQIKEWADGYIVCGGRTWLESCQEDFPWLPDWVWTAVVEQHYAKY